MGGFQALAAVGGAFWFLVEATWAAVGREMISAPISQQPGLTAGLGHLQSTGHGDLVAEVPHEGRKLDHSP